MIDIPTIRDIQALSSSDLQRLVVALFSPSIRARASRDPFDYDLDDTDGLAGVIVRQVSARLPALDGLVLPAIANNAKSLSLARVVLISTGVIDASRRPALDLALGKLKAVTGVTVEVLDAADLAGLVASEESVRTQFFPTPEEAQVVAERNDLDTQLVKAAATVAARHPEDPLGGRLAPFLRLGWAVAVIAGLIAAPLYVSPSEARSVSVIGLAVLFAMLAAAAGAALLFGPALDRFGGVLLEQPLRVPDRTTLLRRINLESTNTLMLFALIGFIAALRLLRLSMISGVLGFIAFFGLCYLLLWSIEPGQCASIGSSCHGAFVNAGTRPAVGDFLYLSGQAAFFNQPAGLGVASRAAKALISAEFLVSAVLLVDLAASIGFPGGFWRLDRGKDRSG